MCCARRARNGEPCQPQTLLTPLRIRPCAWVVLAVNIACAALWLILTALARHGDIAPITPGMAKAVLCLYLLFSFVTRSLCDGQASARRRY